MTFLAANWGWLLLAAGVFTVPALVLGLRGFFRNVAVMPKAMNDMTDTMFEALEGDEAGPDDPASLVGAGMKGFTKGSVGFFGTFFKNMLPAAVFGILSSVSLLLAAIGFIGWLVQH